MFRLQFRTRFEHRIVLCIIASIGLGAPSAGSADSNATSVSSRTTVPMSTVWPFVSIWWP